MTGRLFVLFVVAVLLSFSIYNAYEERQHVLAKFGFKCRDFGGEVYPAELVPAYRGQLCLKKGMLFSLDHIKEKHYGYRN